MDAPFRPGESREKEAKTARMAGALASRISRNALVIIAVILTGAALKWLGAILSPLLLAIFLAIMVDGLARSIRRLAPALPASAAVAGAIVVSMALFAGAALIIANNTATFIGSLSSYEPRLNAVIAKAALALRLKPQSIDQIVSQFDAGPAIGYAAQALQGFVASAGLVLIYLGFLVVSRHTFERKAVRLFRSREERGEALQVFLRIRDSVWRYLWIQTVLGLVIALASWAVMAVVGLDDALFWAFLIFVVNYVPIIGAVVAIGAPALFAVVQFGGLLQPAVILAALFAITFLVGNIALPRMQGRSLNMDPLVVLLSLAFWGALLGLPGMFLSTPLTVLAMVILAQFEGSRWIAVLLSADGEPQALAAAQDKP
ncbi:MAG: AI-2E family transporter [Caulobacteraceae bacterium]